MSQPAILLTCSRYQLCAIRKVMLHDNTDLPAECLFMTNQTGGTSGCALQAASGPAAPTKAAGCTPGHCPAQLAALPPPACCIVLISKDNADCIQSSLGDSKSQLFEVRAAATLRPQTPCRSTRNTSLVCSMTCRHPRALSTCDDTGDSTPAVLAPVVRCGHPCRQGRPQRMPCWTGYQSGSPAAPAAAHLRVQAPK